MEKKGDLDLKLNIIFGMVNQILLIILNLISKNVIQTNLGIEYMGMQSVFSNVCDLLTFAFNGIGVGVLYSFYRPIEESNVVKIQQLYKYYDKVYRTMTCISLGFGVFALFAMPFLINADVSTMRVIVSYLLFLFSVVFYNRYVLLHYILIAFQKRYMVCLVSGIVESIILFIEIIIITNTHSYELFLLCILIKNLLVNYLVYVYLKKKYPQVFAKTATEELPKEERTNILRNLKDLIVCRVGSVLIHSTDSILISGIISTKMSGCYSNYYFVYSGVLGIGTTFFESIISKLGSISVKVSKNEFFQNFWKVSMVTIWLNGFCVTCYYLLIQDFVQLWIGEESILSSELVIVIAANLYLEGMKLVSSTYRKTVGLFDKFDRVILIRGVLNLGLSILLGIYYGLIGILLATLITNLITVYWYVPYRLYKYFEKSLKYELLYQVLGLSSLLVCIWITGTCSAWVEGTTWLGFGVKTLVCGIVSNGCYLVFALVYYLTEKRKKWNMQ